MVAIDAAKSAQFLRELLKQPTGYLNNATDGLAGDVGEYLPNSLAKKDVLNEYTYRTLNEKGPTLIVLHSAGNEDAKKALAAGALYGHEYNNLSFVSLGSPVSDRAMKNSVTGASASYLGQVNDWRDPLTYSKTASVVTVGTGVAGLGAGIWAGASYGAGMGSGLGPLGAIFGGAVGGAVGVIPGGAGLYGLQKYHPFEQYIGKPQSQAILFDWLKNNPPGR